MNSCVGAGPRGRSAASRTASGSAALPTIGSCGAVRMAQRVEHGQRGVLALLFRQRPELRLEALRATRGGRAIRSTG